MVGASAFGWRAVCVKAGIEYGETDDYCYNVAEGAVHVRDLNATILDLLGIDHQQLSLNSKGLNSV